jgi:phenylalanyl-tRNA synthetase beta chain
MKFTVSWLREFLDFTQDVDALSKTLTSLGLEVDALTPMAAGLESFTVAHILEAIHHPDADKLRICTVETHTGTRQIVCGAPNARKGIKVILADIGDIIPTNGMKIKPTAIRGVESVGMLCSARELGLGTDHEGIMELPQDAAIGAKMIDVLHLNDTLLDIAITPNRGDCLGVYGIARDLAAKGFGTLKPLAAVNKPDLPSAVPVTITSQACKHFVVYQIDKVKNAPSPEWLQRRLRSIGLNPISALVDITNYFTHSYGRPLHVYDAACIKDGFTIRGAKGGETLTALDGKDYALPKDACIIADDTAPIGIAGIIGGQATGCSDKTQSVLLEAAWFDPIAIAEAGRALQIDSDARYRFERTVDAAKTEDFAARAAQMIVELCGGRITARSVAGSAPDLKRTITYDPDMMQQRTGMLVAEAKQREILQDLGCIVDAAWNITTPSHRPDIEGAPDITEEILRIIGYDALEETLLPPRRLQPYSPSSTERIRRCLQARGLDEVVHFAFVSEPQATHFSKDFIRVSNPISTELSVMRPHLFADMLPALKRNHDRNNHHVSHFEIGTIFEGLAPDQQPVRAATLRTGSSALHWNAAPKAYTIYDAKADLCAMLDACGIASSQLMITRDVPDYYHPGKSGRLSLGPKHILGYFGELHPALQRGFDIDMPIYASECLIDALPDKQKSQSKQALKRNIFQNSRKDFAFIIDKNIDAKMLYDAIMRADKQLIQQVVLFDSYEGQHIEQSKKSLAFAVTLQAEGRTLQEDDISSVSNAIIKAAEKIGAVLR